MSDRVQKIKKVLSYTELQAFKAVYAEMNGENGVVVVSKILGEVKATRSVAVSAFKKLQIAGVVETRSLGMKGTYIEYLDQEILKELAK
jgi:transcriptional pleiotropic repressor